MSFQQDHSSESGRAAPVSNADTVGRPHRPIRCHPPTLGPLLLANPIAALAAIAPFGRGEAMFLGSFSQSGPRASVALG